MKMAGQGGTRQTAREEEARTTPLTSWRRKVQKVDLALVAEIRDCHSMKDKEGHTWEKCSEMHQSGVCCKMYALKGP